MDNTKNGLVFGIDTSNYTTSVGITDCAGNTIANLKMPLPVKPGERGLRQSDALFAHTMNLPKLLKKAKEITDGRIPVAVGVSTAPRNAEGSYMPCFLAGVAAANALSLGAGIPIYEFSHQCGHIMAALYSANKEEWLDRTFYAFHVSGGTTDLCRVSAEGNGFRSERIGGTLDLNAGQLIDRIGVLMGLPFPAGVHMQALADRNDKKTNIRPPKTEGTFFHLSGGENIAQKLFRETDDKPLTAASVLTFIGKGLIGLCENCFAEYGEAPVIFAGGVMANTQIRRMISERIEAAFAEPALSSDNAVGIARLAYRAHFGKEK